MERACTAAASLTRRVSRRGARRAPVPPPGSSRTTRGRPRRSSSRRAGRRRCSRCAPLLRSCTRSLVHARAASPRCSRATLRPGAPPFGTLCARSSRTIRRRRRHQCHLFWPSGCFRRVLLSRLLSPSRSSSPSRCLPLLSRLPLLPLLPHSHRLRPFSRLPSHHFSLSSRRLQMITNHFARVAASSAKMANIALIVAPHTQNVFALRDHTERHHGWRRRGLAAAWVGGGVGWRRRCGLWMDCDAGALHS